MAQSLINIYENSGKSDQVDQTKDKDPISTEKLRDKSKLEQARRGRVDTTKYSDTVER